MNILQVINNLGIQEFCILTAVWYSSDVGRCYKMVGTNFVIVLLHIHIL